MSGRIRRKLMAERMAQVVAEHHAAHGGDGLICPLCQRPIPDAQKDAHHLVPKSQGGRHTQYLHRICHRQIHALLSEKELARHYNTVEALLALPEIASFVEWVRSKPPEFHERTAKSQRLKRR
jgi:5-methylcytosine-specific restriction endonuclease McrA